MTNEERRDKLELAIASHVMANWSVVSKSDTTAVLEIAIGKGRSRRTLHVSAEGEVLFQDAGHPLRPLNAATPSQEQSAPRIKPAPTQPGASPFPWKWLVYGFVGLFALASLAALAPKGTERSRPTTTVATPTPEEDEQARAQRAAQAEREREAEAKKDAECRADLRCWGEKHDAMASVRCPSLVERLAKNDYEWTDGFLEPKLSRYRWKDKARGTLTYIGDKIKYQNGFGAWIHHIYECDFDPSTQAVTDVRARPGRLD